MKKIIATVASLLMCGAAYGQTSQTFNSFLSGLSTATTPLASGDVFYVMQNGASKQIPKKNIAPEVVNVIDYGVKCDGSTDDAANLQTAFTAGAGKLIILPAGTCNFSTTLFLLGTGTSLRGAGRSATMLRSTFLTGDELHIGDSTSCPVNGDCGTVATYNYHLSDFTLFSTVTRTNGYTMWIHNADQVYIDNVENNNDLLNAYSGGNVHYKGILTDHSGATHIDHSEFWAQGDVWTITQSTDSSMHDTNLRYGTIGLRLAGGASGFHCTQSNIESNSTNLLIDNSIATTVPNHSGEFGAACYIDTASGDNVSINTAIGGLNVFWFSATSIETENGNAVSIISAPNDSHIIFDNVAIGSYSGSGTGHGIVQADCTTLVSITGGSRIWHNSGYGINQTCSPSVPNPMYIASDTYFSNNTLGNASFTLSTMTGGADQTKISSSGTLTLAANNSGVLWQIQTNGNLFAGVDNSYNIGDTAANRPAIIYAGTGFVAPLATPASAAAACTAGRIAWDASYVYICTASGAWKRVAIATWP